MAEPHLRTDIYANRDMAPEEVRQLRAVLTDKGLGIVGEAVQAPGLTALSVAPDADPFAVADVLNAGPEKHDFRVGRSYRSATDFLQLAGKSWGHGLLFTPLTSMTGDSQEERYRRPLPEWDPPAAGPSPVIALLDSGVVGHEQLPAATGTPFVVSHPDTAMPMADAPAEHRVKMAYGHATFIAGLIRMEAPTAQVLSLKIMGTDGRITESAFLAAIGDLIKYRRDGNRLDVVCMAFGEHLDAGEEPPTAVREKLAELAGLGVRMAAAAGNAGTDEPVYPAAFAAEIGRLDSVGAGVTRTDRDFYSGYGDWVTCWRNGTATSIMPGRPPGLVPEDDEPDFPEDGWAQWQGTSFAVVRRVCELANEAV